MQPRRLQDLAITSKVICASVERSRRTIAGKIKISGSCWSETADDVRT